MVVCWCCSRTDQIASFVLPCLSCPGSFVDAGLGFDGWRQR
ncbi:hypothetical protein SynNOUM97013_01316 [Synechococcus sp. NOUM97013]|nr:hypothetical protein SynNOUM97013_01316 [Synechococcus sp. NOUM97013]